jgi:phage regulator Rha-like protein
MTSLNTNATLTTSSHEIAKLLDCRHDNVLTDIRKMLTELYGDRGLLSFQGYYTAGNGKQNPCFHLPCREVEILMTGYSLPLRAKVIDRLYELEQAHKPAALPTTYLDALKALVASTEAQEALGLENEAMKQAAKIGEASGRLKRLTVTDMARQLHGTTLLRCRTPNYGQSLEK